MPKTSSRRCFKKLRKNAAEAKLENIQTVLGGEADPKLPPNTLDLILLVDVYHEFSQPQRMLRRMREALKPDGRLVLLEYRKEDPSIPIRPEHKMSVQEVKLELEAEGFHLDQSAGNPAAAAHSYPDEGESELVLRLSACSRMAVAVVDDRRKRRQNGFP